MNTLEQCDMLPKVKESIQRIIVKEGYLSYDITQKGVNTDGSYLGILLAIDIKGKTIDGEKETNLFIKQIISNTDFKLYSVTEVFSKEAFVYKELRKVFEELQEEYNVPKEERFKMLHSYDEMCTEGIILENATKRGLKAMYRMDIMTFQFAKMSVEQLAKFHGLSFVIQAKKPQYFDTKVNTIKQSFIFDELWREFVKKMCDISIEKFDDNIKNKIDKFFKISLDKFPKYMQGKGSASSARCLCHGDYKMNNILLKEQNSQLIEVIPIDYQQIYFGSPIIDFIYLVYAASDRDFRKNHMNELKDAYFESLTKFLKFFEMDVNSVYSRDDFEKDFRDCIDYALMFCLFYYPFFFTLEDDVPDLDKDELLEVTVKLDDQFMDRMRGVIDDFIEMGYL